MVSLSESVAWWARTEPERIAVVYGAERLTYARLNQRVSAVAGLLMTYDIKPGDIVALLMKNSAAFIEISLAVSQLGAVLLPINYRLSKDEVAYIAGHAGAKLMFADAELLAFASGCERVVTVDEAAQADSSCLAANLTAWAHTHPSQPDNLFRLMYTSGTTDRPKGVMHSYDNYAWKSLDHITVLGLTDAERLLIVGPLYHVGAFDMPGLAVFLVGGMIAVLRDFDPDATLELIEKERLTGGWMAPVMMNRCLALDNHDRFDLSSFRWLIGGGERTPEERILEFSSLFTSARYIDAYGLTETCAGDTMMEAGYEIERIGSTGRAVPHVQIEICDENGQSLPAGSAGEVCLRGPKVTRGYWRDPVKTAASFDGAWFRTGDMGHLDADGFLYLTDRKKDMIISGGENIASSEVERVLYQLAEVAEAAVVGLPDERWGERVVAVVVLRPDATLTIEQLRAHCDGLLGGFKVPKQLVVLDALPRNPSGKVLKRVLREELTT